MFSQLFILSSRGDAIIFRDYRAELPKSVSEVFFREICRKKRREGHERDNEEVGKRADELAADAPAFNVEGVNYVYMEVNRLYLVVTSLCNVSPLLAVDLLSSVAHVIKDYCGVFTEDSVRKNFVLVYELLEEVLDFGYPQFLSSEALRPCVYNLPKPVDDGPLIRLPQWAEGSRKSQCSNAANRPLALEDGANEIFVDLIENISVVFDAEGQVVHSQIDGQLALRSYLLGEPTIRIGFNHSMVVRNRERVTHHPEGCLPLDDLHFHPCVSADTFDTDRSVWLHPPQGYLAAMSYRISKAHIRPPLVLSYKIIEVSPASFELRLSVRTNYSSEHSAKRIAVICPLPPGVEGVSFSHRHAGEEQMAEFNRKQNVIVWNIEEMCDGAEEALLARIAFEAGRAAPEGIVPSFGPISMDFEIPMLLLSGSRILSLDINERSEDYKPQRWVRYVTQSNSYLFRI